MHAVAMDEKRRPFAPTFWTIPKGQEPEGHVEQVWFVGAHANVGGSYRDAGLSDLSLLWMIARVMDIGQSRFSSALEFNRAFLRECAHPSPFAALYRSEHGWPISTVFPYRRPVLAPNAIQVRAMVWNGENKKERHINEKIHWSILERLGKIAKVNWLGQVRYEPKNLTQTPPSNAIASMTSIERELLAP